jgi:UPF0271 protein
MRLNCDLGEDYGVWRMSVDDSILSFLDQANVSCGFHAGDPLSIERTVKQVIKQNLSIGAHPSYPDRLGFGRRHMAMEKRELIACIRYQIAAIRGVVGCFGGQLSYVKPHGALYNDLMVNQAIRRSVFTAVASFEGLELMVQAHPLRETLITEASEFNLTLQFEAFADRLYLDDGSLASRSSPGAVLDEASAIMQAKQLITSHVVTTGSGEKIPIIADTLCVHGDTPAALNIAKAVRAML